jgi:hypothetical protein
VIPCRGRLDSTASQSVISTRDDTSDIQSVILSAQGTGCCQKSMNPFVREPPQPVKDPCCRIKEPSCPCIDEDCADNDIKIRSCV